MNKCKQLGWLVGRAEQWVNIPGHPAGGIRRDLFGWIDIVAITAETSPQVIGIQACTMGDRAAHLAKMTASDEVTEAIMRWLSAGCRAELWAFRKLLIKRGGKAVKWECAATDLADLTTSPADSASASRGPCDEPSSH